MICSVNKCKESQTFSFLVKTSALWFSHQAVTRSLMLVERNISQQKQLYENIPIQCWEQCLWKIYRYQQTKIVTTSFIDQDIFFSTFYNF